MKDNILSMLGLMRRASALAIGYDNTADGLNSGKVKLVLVPADASEKRKKDVELALRGRNAISVNLPYTADELAEAAGVSGCAVLGVKDLGFADSLLKKLAETDEVYAGAYEELHRRNEKAKRRRNETRKYGKKNQREGE